MLPEKLKTIENLGTVISSVDDDKQAVLIEKLIYIVNGFNIGWDARDQQPKESA